MSMKHTAIPALLLIGALTFAARAEAQTPLAQDLVYTPVRACRILDTRSRGTDGRVAAGTTRSFIAARGVDFGAQGGEPGDCRLSWVHDAAAVALSVTVVSPGAPGYATVYPFGSSRPLTASLTYSADAFLTSMVVSAIGGPGDSADLTLFTHADADYVIDIVGYFTQPLAEPLDCVENMPASIMVVPGQTGTVSANACPVGRLGTATNCSTTGIMPLLSSRNGTCRAINQDAIATLLTVSFTCCRVPGR